MEIFFASKEALFLTFKLANGSGWLTNYRLILCEHDPGHLEGHKPVIYALKDFQEAQIKGSNLILCFKGKRQAKILLPENAPSILQEIKDYIEEAAKSYGFV
jgi:hypothetical protein